MWDYRYLSRIDYRTVPLVLALMWISILVISAMTGNGEVEAFMTNSVKIQIQWFMIGWVVYFFCVGMDYRKLRSWSWIMYVGILLLLVGLFFTTPIQNVHRWYRIPFLGREFQPSEYAKLIVVITLSCFLESKGRKISSWSTAFQALAIVFVPFVLILKQPDLGTSLVLFPIALVMFYFGGIHRKVVAAMTVFGVAALLFVGLMFTGVLSHEGTEALCNKIFEGIPI
jgi:rod shape determining protein RodA